MNYLRSSGFNTLETYWDLLVVPPSCRCFGFFCFHVCEFLHPQFSSYFHLETKDKLPPSSLSIISRLKNFFFFFMSAGERKQYFNILFRFLHYLTTTQRLQVLWLWSVVFQVIHSSQAAAKPRNLWSSSPSTCTPRGWGSHARGKQVFHRSLMIPFSDFYR